MNGTHATQPKISEDLERRLAIYLFLKGKGLTLDEIKFITQPKEFFPKIISDESLP